MYYDAELAFIKTYLRNYHIQCLIINEANTDLEQIDLGLRKMLGLQTDYDKLAIFLTKQIQPIQIYQIKDEFLCNYYLISLPDTAIPSTLIIGPFLTEYPKKSWLLGFVEKYNILPSTLVLFEKYFENLPFYADDVPFLTLLHTFGERIWGSSDQFTVLAFEGSVSDTYAPSTPASTLSEEDSAAFHMKAIEARYALENELLTAVSQGKAHVAKMVLNRLSTSAMERCSQDSLRNLKNYTIIMNTLLRKAAENGAVHPFHIDKLSSEFGRKIELTDSKESCSKLQQEMIRKYCFLVKNHSMKGYSQLIQKVISQIDSDMSGDLSLNAIATELNVNPSYLSSQFKKETGSTLTDYVNRKRVELAISLLNSTTFQIQTIALHCGIPDVNYFTKIFKKYIRKTPKEYRDNINLKKGFLSPSLYSHCR